MHYPYVDEAADAARGQMPEFQDPYWYAKDDLPGLDFNREIIEPGTHDKYPDGVLGIRVDDDFWAVAALPLAEYRDKPLPEIVNELWPTYVGEATYAPDSGTIEQKVHFLETQLEHMTRRAKRSETDLREARSENERLLAGRTDLSPRRRTRLEAVDGYFIRQYEHLLTALAHEAVPRPDPERGICSVCGLYTSDRIHQKEWIDRHAAGYRPHMEWHRDHGDDRDLGNDREPEDRD